MTILDEQFCGFLTRAKRSTNEFLKDALRAVPLDAPYRGPAVYQHGDLLYRCNWQGESGDFSGQEVIDYKGRIVYRLNFHGGSIC